MLSPLFELDPLSRRTFLLVVPCRAFDKVASSERFAPVEIYTTLARILSEKDYMIEEEVYMYFYYSSRHYGGYCLSCCGR